MTQYLKNVYAKHILNNQLKNIIITYYCNCSNKLFSDKIAWVFSLAHKN